MFCSKCGSKLDDGDIFCSNCGAKTKIANKSSYYNHTVASTSTTSPKTTMNNYVTNDSSKDNFLDDDDDNYYDSEPNKQGMKWYNALSSWLLLVLSGWSIFSGLWNVCSTLLKYPSNKLHRISDLDIFIIVFGFFTIVCGFLFIVSKYHLQHFSPWGPITYLGTKGIMIIANFVYIGFLTNEYSLDLFDLFEIFEDLAGTTMLTVNEFSELITISTLWGVITGVIVDIVLFSLEVVYFSKRSHLFRK